MKRKLLLFAVIILSSIITVTAQRHKLAGKSIEEKAEFKTAKMLENGLIDKSQYDEVLAINLESARKRDIILKEQKAIMSEFRKKHESISEQTLGELKGILSDEQIKRLTEKREQRAKRKKKGMKEKKGKFMEEMEKE